MTKKPIPILGRSYVDGDTQFSLCVRCKHKFLGKAGCAAFPDGIPAEFARGITEHRYPHPSDNGIQFEEIDR
jgi:hypothetical protein